jgi:hypothetical protein
MDFKQLTTHLFPVPPVFTGISVFELPFRPKA